MVTCPNAMTRMILPLLEAPPGLEFKPLSGPLHLKLSFRMSGLHFLSFY